MSLNNSDFNDSGTSSLLLNRIKFSIFLTLQVPSMICSCYLFVQCFTRKNLRQSIHNHVSIVLLYSSFVFVAVPVSASEAFFFTSQVRPASYLFCSFWTWIHYSTNVSNLILMSFACAERHWLLFRLNSIRTQRMRIIYHYIPIATCIIYPYCFYFTLIFLYSCEYVYDFTQLLCVMPCYFLNNFLGNLDTYLNLWTPNLAIPILCGTLFIRFLIQKRRMRLEIFRWKRDRKLVIQLLTITLLYILMWSPVQAAAIYDSIWSGGLSSQFEVDYLYTLPYFIHLLYPFVLFLSNSEFRRRNRTILPQGNQQLERISRIHIN